MTTITATTVKAGDRIRPVRFGMPTTDEPVSMLVDEVRPTSRDHPMTVGLLVDGAWIAWPAEAMFEVMP